MRSTVVLGVAALGAFSILRPGVADATWPTDSHTNVPICTAAHAQVEPSITTDGAGGAIITWQDLRKTDMYGSSSDADIYAQRVDANGVTRWTLDGVGICTANKHQIDPSIVSDGAGGAIIVWSDSRAGGPLVAYAQRVDANGVPQWTRDGVAVCKAFGGQLNVAAVADGAGGAIVVWQDGRHAGGFDIYAQRIDGSGASQWATDGVALCTNAATQLQPAVAADGTGGAIVAWQDARGSRTGIFAQRVDGRGELKWTTDGVAVCAVDRDGLGFPSVAADGDQGAFVTWEDRRGRDAKVYAQHLDAAGSGSWAANGLSLCGADGAQLTPTLAADDSGGAIVAWEDDRNPNDPQVYAQHVRSSGALAWGTEGLGIAAAPGGQARPALVPDGAGGAILSWEDTRGSNSDIYAQRVSSTGVLQWANAGVAVSAADQDQLRARLVTDMNGGAIVTWGDFRTGTSWDVYAQRVDHAGNLGGANH